MPPIETFHRHQKAVLWPFGGYDSYGQPLAAGSTTPVQLDVRWETGKREALDPDGNTIGVDATVVVDRQIAVGSEMWLGKISQLVDSKPPSSRMRVVTYSEIPDLKNRHVRREVGLMRIHETPPQ